MLAGIVRVIVRFVVFVPLLRWLGDKRTLFLGLSIFVVVFFALGFVQTTVEFVLVLCGVSFAAACTRGVMNSFVSRSVQPWQQGQAMGLSASLDSLAQILGPALGGYVLGAYPVWTYGALASVFALGAFLMLLRRTEFPSEHGVAEGTP
jgi:MFS family permease